MAKTENGLLLHLGRLILHDSFDPKEAAYLGGMMPACRYFSLATPAEGGKENTGRVHI
jgi:hypothetical protein